ncbi:MAG: hypothetical protein FWF82_01770, partial [Oscillospiraceae bacterium]|nr:hypothetical protein [Oscillospiraceae bacterium]
MNKILNFKGDYKGLDSETVQEKIGLYGYNSANKHINPDLAAPKKIKFYSVFKSLRVYLMLAAAAVYFFANDGLKGGLLIFLTLAICIFEIIVENHCAARLWKLRDSSRVIVRVVRDGTITLIKREEIVQDDLLILQGGESVPADAHILETSGKVTVDESMYGQDSHEFEPVDKFAGSDSNNELKKSCVYKGSRVLSGMLIARVNAIGQDVKSQTDELIPPPKKGGKELHYTELESYIARQATLCTYAAAVILVIVTVIRIIAAGGTEPHEGTSLLLYLSAIVLPAVSFALCAIPVSLPLIIRLYYVNGATALSYKYGDIKRLHAVETLNSVTAVCLDKDLVVAPDSTPIAAESGKNKVMLSRIAVLSCDPRPVSSYEKAISVGAAFKHIDVKELFQNTLLKKFAPENGDYNNIHGNLWEINGARLLCIKGAPEKVMSFCSISPDERFHFQQRHSNYAKEGFHVLAVAFKQVPLTDEEGNPVPLQRSLFDAEYTFLG